MRASGFINGSLTDSGIFSDFGEQSDVVQHTWFFCNLFSHGNLASVTGAAPEAIEAIARELGVTMIIVVDTRRPTALGVDATLQLETFLGKTLEGLAEPED